MYIKECYKHYFYMFLKICCIYLCAHAYIFSYFLKFFTPIPKSYFYPQIGGCSLLYRWKHNSKIFEHTAVHISNNYPVILNERASRVAYARIIWPDFAKDFLTYTVDRCLPSLLGFAWLVSTAFA